MKLDTIIQRFEQEEDVYDQNGNKIYPFDIVISTRYDHGDHKISINAIEDIISKSKESHYLKLNGCSDYVDAKSVIKIDDAFFAHIDSMKQEAKRALDNFINAPKRNFYVVGYFSQREYDSDNWDKKILKEEYGVFQARVPISTDKLSEEELTLAQNTKMDEVLNRVAEVFMKRLTQQHKEHPLETIRCVFPTFNGYGGRGSGMLSGLWAHRRRNSFWYNDFSSRRISASNEGRTIRYFVYTEENKPFKQDPDEEIVKFIWLGHATAQSKYEECVSRVKQLQKKAPKIDNCYLVKKTGKDSYSLSVNTPVTMMKKQDRGIRNTTVNPIIIALAKAQVSQYPNNNLNEELTQQILTNDYHQFWYDEMVKRFKYLISEVYTNR